MLLYITPYRKALWLQAFEWVLIFGCLDLKEFLRSSALEKDEVPFAQGNEGVESRRIIRYPQSTATEVRPALDLPPPAQY